MDQVTLSGRMNSHCSWGMHVEHIVEFDRCLPIPLADALDKIPLTEDVGRGVFKMCPPPGFGGPLASASHRLHQRQRMGTHDPKYRDWPLWACLHLCVHNTTF